MMAVQDDVWTLVSRIIDFPHILKNVNLPGPRGEHAIHHVRSMKMLALLLSKGADIHVRDENGATCMHHIADIISNYTEVVSFFSSDDLILNSQNMKEMRDFFVMIKVMALLGLNPLEKDNFHEVLINKVMPSSRDELRQAFIFKLAVDREVACIGDEVNMGEPVSYLASLPPELIVAICNMVQQSLADRIEELFY